MSRWRAPGVTSVALADDSQSATWLIARSGRNGDGNRPSLVVSRMNASNGTQAKPTSSAPDSVASSQRSDARWCSLAEFTAYSSTFASTIFTRDVAVAESAPRPQAHRPAAAPGLDSPSGPPDRRPGYGTS